MATNAAGLGGVFGDGSTGMPGGRLTNERGRVSGKRIGSPVTLPAQSAPDTLGHPFTFGPCRTFSAHWLSGAFSPIDSGPSTTIGYRRFVHPLSGEETIEVYETTRRGIPLRRIEREAGSTSKARTRDTIAERIGEEAPVLSVTVEPIRPQDIRAYGFNRGDVEALLARFSPQTATLLIRAVSKAMRESGIEAYRFTRGERTGYRGDTGYSDILSIVATVLRYEFGPFAYEYEYPIPAGLIVVKVYSIVRDWQRSQISQRRGGSPYADYSATTDSLNTPAARAAFEATINNPETSPAQARRLSWRVRRASATATRLKNADRTFRTAEEEAQHLANVNRSGAFVRDNMEVFTAKVYDRLTDSEKDLVGLILRGLTLSQIAKIEKEAATATHKRLHRVILKARTYMGVKVSA